MIIVFPIGVEDAEVNRLPWVSISIAALCCIAFLFSWVIPEHPMGIDQGSLGEVIQYWQEHPYLQLPEAFKDRFVPQRVWTHFRPESSDGRPDDETVQKEQATLEAMAGRVLELSDRSILRRFSLIPARGIFQLGWLTHLFLHFGWMHLLGNLFFFYLVGPLMEDVWGRPLFAGFYLAGGVVAAAAHVLLDRASTIMMVGASGAIAACMGAFALRYAKRRVRLAYFVWILRIWRGTTFWPAWLCGLLWFLNEGWDFLRSGGNSGVAVMAHLGGFAFGALLAFGLRASGVESKYVAPKVEATFTWQQHPSIQNAQTALERGELSAAAAAYREALAADPKNLEAQFGLAKIALLEKRTAEGAQRLDSLLTRTLAQSSRGGALNWIEELLPNLELKQLGPALAYKIGQVLEGAPEGLQPNAEQYYGRAAQGGGVLGAKAAIRAAAIALSAPDRAAAALEHLAAAAANPALPPECKAQLAELQAQAAKKRVVPLPITEPTFQPTGASPAYAQDSVASPTAITGVWFHSRPKIVAGRLRRLVDEGLELEVQAKSARVSWERLAAVGVGVLPGSSPNGAPKNLVVMDLVVSARTPDGAPTVLRIPGGALGLDVLYPGTPPPEAFRRLLANVLTRSRAKGLTDVEELSSGNYPRFANVAELEKAFYGAAA